MQSNITDERKHIQRIYVELFLLSH
uniref:Uncharacterized protein n=1 Tax=Arundo donax TaxID=35708 RepID=A0A0A9GAF8_ARUDO